MAITLVKIIHLWTEGLSMEFAYPVPVTEKSIWFYGEIPRAEYVYDRNYFL
jgi:hypothetical protein